MDKNELLASVQKYKTSYERDVLHILNLAPGMPPVHPETPVAEARRNYMKIAALIHPDKFTGSPALQASATEAFQVLVKGFEFFASPNFRKAATAQVTKKAARAPKVKQPVVKPAKPAKTPAVKKAAKPAPKPKGGKMLLDDDDASEDDDESNESDAASDEEDDHDDDGDDETMDALWSAALAAPKRAPKEVLTRNRTNDGCLRTTVKCPRCATAWQPDDNKQYSLFMGYGLRIHCQLCLLLYGCATATHACGCGRPFDYDTSMYDSKVLCGNGKCKKSFGFMYYPVTGEHLNKIREADQEEEAKRRNAEEREARARARGGDDKPAPSGAKVSDDEMLTLVGKCVVDEECPICNKRVASKHRSHVEACLKNPPAPKKTRVVRKFIDDDDKRSSSKPKPKASKPKPKASLGTKGKPAKPQRRKRNRDSDDDSD